MKRVSSSALLRCTSCCSERRKQGQYWIRQGPLHGVIYPTTLMFFIDNALAENDELTAKQLKDLTVQKWADLPSISLTTIKRARKYLGWTSSKPKFCQIIQEANKEKWLNWAKEQIAKSETFHDVIFSDECSVEIDFHNKICFRKKGQLRKLKPRPKHPLKVHIWGGTCISKRGATQIIIFTGILTATCFTEVIKAGLLPFIAAEFPSHHRFSRIMTRNIQVNMLRHFFKAIGGRHLQKVQT